MKTAIVYPFFATYRKPVIEQLCASSGDQFMLVSDTVNRIMPGVPPWRPGSRFEFVPATCYVFPGGFLFQRKVIGLPFRKDLDAIIYLGDWKYISTWISAIAARLLGKRVLFWTHGWRVPDKGLKRFVRKRFYRLANGMLLFGNNAREIAISEQFSPESLYVIFNSLDYQNHVNARNSITQQDIEQQKQALFSRPDFPIVFFVGRLTARKRMDLLI